MPLGKSVSTSARTQLDLAKLAGVSAVTVHKALTNQSGVSEKVRTRISELATRHGYRLNVSARAMRTGRFGNVALVLSDEPSRSTIPTGLLAGVRQALDQSDSQLTLASLPDERLTSDGFVPKILREWSADGLLINYTDHIPKKMLELIRGHHIPSVWMNVDLEQDCVYPDDFDAGVRATHVLLERGHRDIVFVDFTHEPDAQVHFSAHRRREGYLAAMRDAGARPRVVQKRVEHADFLSAAQSILNGAGSVEEDASSANHPCRPTGIVSYAGPELTAIYIAAIKAGLDVPRDLSLVTFGGNSVWIAGLHITILKVPEQAIGRTAVQMLNEKIDQPGRALRPAILKFSLEEGRSVAPCGA